MLRTVTDRLPEDQKKLLGSGSSKTLAASLQRMSRSERSTSIPYDERQRQDPPCATKQFSPDAHARSEAD